MQAVMPEAREDTVTRWRSSAGGDSPAGPLYAAGEFAEADIAAPDLVATVAQYSRCSLCTASGGIACC